MYKKILETAQWLKDRMTQSPDTAIILGTGLGQLASEICVEKEILYADIPNFPVTTVDGHAGRLIFGTLGGKQILAMKGRFHYYEGYSMKEVTFPVRVMKELGVKTLYLTNAAGGVNPSYRIGDIMIISDQINNMPENPLHGENIPQGPRFPDMGHAYDPELIDLADAIAAEQSIKVRHGVYVATQGPCYETPAEYRMYARWGGDAVGMSTVPEVIVARHVDIRCFGISIITDLGGHAQVMKVTHEDVQKAANEAQPRVAAIMREMIARS